MYVCVARVRFRTKIMERTSVAREDDPLHWESFIATEHFLSSFSNIAERECCSRALRRWVLPQALFRALRWLRMQDALDCSLLTDFQ